MDWSVDARNTRAQFCEKDQFKKFDQTIPTFPQNVCLMSFSGRSKLGQEGARDKARRMPLC